MEKKNQPYTVKTHKHVATSSALNVHYLKEALTKEYKYFSYRGEYCAYVFSENIIYDFPKFY